MPDFQVKHAFLCDYASTDLNGKALYAGVYNSEIRYPFDVQVWSPLFVVVSVKALSQIFTILIRFITPSGKEMILVTNNFKAETPIPGQFFLNVGFQIPAVKFTGFGDYRLEILNGSNELAHCEVISLIKGGPMNFNPSVTGEMRVNA